VGRLRPVDPGFLKAIALMRPAGEVDSLFRILGGALVFVVEFGL